VRDQGIDIDLVVGTTRRRRCWEVHIFGRYAKASVRWVSLQLRTPICDRSIYRGDGGHENDLGGNYKPLVHLPLHSQI
jgi:hypothetical protein